MNRNIVGLIARFRERVPHEVFDYQVVMDCLQGYARPRDKLTNLMAAGTIVRVKKGLYVLGEPFRHGPVSREVLANLIYGPSCISLDYALQHYGMIPEGVEAVTSVAPGRSRSFQTPFGLFTYRTTSPELYRIGIDRAGLDDGRAYLIATREKALVDKLAASRGTGIRTLRELESFLTDSLRVDRVALAALDRDRIAEMADASRSRRARLLAHLVGRLQHDGRGAA